MRRKRRGWSPGDLDYPARLKPQKGATGAWVYLPREHIILAFGREKGPPPAVDQILATRIVLDPGTGQILIRLKKGL